MLFRSAAAVLILAAAPMIEAPKSDEIDLAHGTAQVEGMIRDHPDMEIFISRARVTVRLRADSPVRVFMAREYGRSINGGRLFYGGHEVAKPPHYMVEHTIPARDTPGRINLRREFLDLSTGKVRPLTAEEKWSCCVFESFNIKNAEAFMALYHDAIAGRVSRDAYVVENQKLEFNAIRSLRRFYRSVWKPRMDAMDVESHPAVWQADDDGDFEKWISRYKGSDVYRFWENYYDREIAPSLNAPGNRSPR